MTYEEFKAGYEAFKASDNVVISILKKSRIGKATYTDAAKYAERVGSYMSKTLGKAFSAEIENLVREDVVSVMLPSMSLGYSDVADLAGGVNDAINASARVGLKTIIPEANKQRIFGIIDKMTDHEQSDPWMLGKDVMQNFARSAVTDTIEQNAQLASDAGLVSYISRSSGGGCCKWCDEQAGTFEYGKQPDDFFRVHKDCTCEITYMPSKQRWQRITFSTVNEGGSKRTTRNVVDI